MNTAGIFEQLYQRCEICQRMDVHSLFLAQLYILIWSACGKNGKSCVNIGVLHVGHAYEKKKKKTWRLLPWPKSSEHRSANSMIHEIGRGVPIADQNYFSDECRTRCWYLHPHLKNAVCKETNYRRYTRWMWCPWKSKWCSIWPCLCFEKVSLQPRIKGWAFGLKPANTDSVLYVMQEFM